MKKHINQLLLLAHLLLAPYFLFSQVIRAGIGASLNFTNLINGSVIYTNATHSSKTNNFYIGGGTFASCNIKPIKGDLSPMFGVDIGYSFARYGQYYDITHPVGLMNQQTRQQTWFDKSIHNLSTNFKLGIDYRNAYFLTGFGIDAPINGNVKYSVAVDGGQRQFNSYSLRQTGTNNFKTTFYWLFELGYNVNCKKNITLSPFLHYKILLSPIDRTETYYFPVNGRIGQAAIGISLMYSLKLKSKVK